MCEKQQFACVEEERYQLETALNRLTKEIGNIPIASPQLMPYGWRKAAKGRTVWRIVEEVISQGLESRARQLGFQYVYPAESEVGVYDFRFSFSKDKESYVNIKSAVAGKKGNSDDISKAEGLIDFYGKNPDADLYIATFVINFNEDMTIGLNRSIVFPTAWIPDVYVNPSNNGNLQSAKYKDLNSAVKRTPQEFLDCLIEANQTAIEKKKKRKNIPLY